MAWKCPECGEGNHDDTSRCFCGHDLSETGRKQTADADRVTAKKTMSDAPSKNRSTSKGVVDMVGASLLQRKALVQQWLWVSWGVIVAGLVLLVIVLMSDDARADIKIIIFPVVGISLLIQTILRSKKPIVIIHKDHVESSFPRLELVRYRDIQKVERPDHRRLILVARTNDGDARKITIHLDTLEKDQGEQLAAFLSSKAAAA